MRAQLGHVGGDGDGDPARLSRSEVVEVEGAKLRVDDRPGAGRGRLEVGSVVVDHLGDRAGLRVEAEEGHRPVAVGEEVDLVAHPHRVRVDGAVARDGHDARIRQVGDPDRGGHPAAVVLDGDVRVGRPVAPVPEREVGQAAPVGRVGSLHAHRQGQGRRKAPGCRHGEEPLIARREALPVAAVQDALAVRRPRERDIRRRVVGEPARLSARCRHHIDVGVAVHVAREGDHRPVRGEDGPRVDPGARDKPAGFAAVAAHGP